MEIDQSNGEQFTSILREWAEIFMRRSMHEFRRFSQDSGLSMVQFNVLFRLYYTGFCGVSEIGEHLSVTNAAASQLVDRLVGQGILQRTEDTEDRRVKKITLSPRGRQLVEEAIEARRSWMEQLTAALSESEQESIGRALVALTEAARRLEVIN